MEEHSTLNTRLTAGSKAGTNQRSEELLALLQCKVELQEAGYNPQVIARRLAAQRHFLAYLRQRKVLPEAARLSDVAGFLKTKLREYRARHGHRPSDIGHWRNRHTGAIHRLLRIIQGRWPPEGPTSNAERFQRGLLEGYRRWLTEVCGLSQQTLCKNSRAARIFLLWLGGRTSPESLALLKVVDIDAYLAWRMPRLRRTTRYGVCQCMRSFLRYLHVSRRISTDLSRSVSGPIMYGDEEIPRSFTEEQIRAVLECTRSDRSPKGLRDYAMLLMLATYGLRAGEVVWLSLQDIDWREAKLRVRRSKTRTESFLPLLRPVGDALVKYLKHGRPKAAFRQVFLRSRAPFRPFSDTSPLNYVILARLKEAGIEVQGRHGAHAFRFARALSLLRASVPLKSISDLLGHKTTSATRVYLRLETEDLRAISLEVPKKDSDANLAR
jgi:integrase/recombinase XerD